MSASPRLLDDPGISEKVRSDLRRAELYAVAPFDTAAGLARFRAGLEGAGAALDGAGKVTTSPAVGGALSGSSWKLFVALGALGVVAWVLLSGSSGKTSSSSTAHGGVSAPLVETVPESAQKSGAAASKPTRGGETQGSVTVPPTPSAAESSLGNREAKETVSARPPGKITAAPTARAENPDPLTEEISHLAELRQLHRTDPRAAIGLAKDGHKKFPQGMLYEEREALLILSLQSVGESAEAQRRATEFQSRFPTSAFLSKMRRLSPGTEESPGAAP